MWLSGTSAGIASGAANARTTGSGASDLITDPSVQAVPWEVEETLSAVLEATRSLLWIKSPAEASALAQDLVAHLGGGTRPATSREDGTIPVDISFGAGPPIIPADFVSSAGQKMLELHLPAFMRDAHRALELADRTTRLAREACIDSLTGLPNRRTMGRELGAMRPDDVVIAIDVDHFKKVNDTFGHAAGDRVLRLLGLVLAATVRATDRVGRFGGEEFVVIVSEGAPEPSSSDCDYSGKMWDPMGSPSQPA